MRRPAAAGGDAAGVWADHAQEVLAARADPDVPGRGGDLRHTRDVDSARIRIVGPTIGDTEFGALIGMTSHYPAGRARYTATATVVGTDDAKDELRTAGTLTLSEGTKVTITVSTRSLKVRNS